MNCTLILQSFTVLKWNKYTRFLPRVAEQWVKGALLYEHREWSQWAISHITNVFSYNIHGVSTYKFKQIGHYESVIYINTNDKGKFWSSCLFSLSYTFIIIIVLFLSWKAENCASFQIRFLLRTWEQIVHNTASVLHSNVFFNSIIKNFTLYLHYRCPQITECTALLTSRSRSDDPTSWRDDVDAK